MTLGKYGFDDQIKGGLKHKSFIATVIFAISCKKKEMINYASVEARVKNTRSGGKKQEISLKSSVTLSIT